MEENTPFTIATRKIKMPKSKLNKKYIKPMRRKLSNMLRS